MNEIDRHESPSAENVTASPRKAKGRLRALACVFFAFGAALLFSSVARDYVIALGSPDGIYIPNARHEFSPMRGGSLAHTFRVYNLRPRRLAVRVEPDCDCTGVSWQHATIAPFSWKDLTAKMDAQPAKSKHSRSVAIALRTDSRARPFLFIFLIA